MKKTIQVLSIFYCIMPLHGASVEQSASSSYARAAMFEGWYFFNGTEGSLTIRSFPGNKEKKEILLPCETKFIESEANMHIVIRRPDGFSTPIDCDKLPPLQVRDHVDCELLTIQENNIDERFEVISSTNSVLVCNRTDHSQVYYSWYRTVKSRFNRHYQRITEPRIIGETGHCTSLYCPNGPNIILAISSDKNGLNANSLEKGHFAIPKDSLMSGSREVILFGGPKKALELLETQENLSLINTTNKIVYCTLVKYVDNVPKEIISTVCHKLNPQNRTLIPYFSAKEMRAMGGEFKLVISHTELKILDLTRTEIQENIAIFNLPENISLSRSLIIKTKLDGGCPFEIGSFGPANARLLRGIYLNFNPARNNFAAGILAQVEQEMLSLNQRAQSRSLGKVLQMKASELPKENTFLKKRETIVWASIMRLLGKKNICQIVQEESGESISSSLSSAEVAAYLGSKFRCPKIAFVSTGGGYRALVETLGFLKGAEELGILGCCSYMCGLSGSTWAIAGLVASGKSVSQFANEQRMKISASFKQSSSDASELFEKGSLKKLLSNVLFVRDYVRQTLIQSHYNQVQGLIGQYGHALSHVLLDGIVVNGKTKHEITLSDLQTNLEEAKYPLPICIAVESTIDTNARYWVEFTPYYVGTFCRSLTKGMLIETEDLGSILKDGKMVQLSPEYTLAQCFGIWGSAFALTSSENGLRTSAAGSIVNAIECFDKLSSSSYAILFPRTAVLSKSQSHTLAKAPSFLQVSDENTHASSKTNTEADSFHLDAGMSLVQGNTHNYSTMPALAREVDVLILCDCTAKAASEVPKDLLAAENGSEEHELLFPKITAEHIRLINDEWATAVLIEEGANSWASRGCDRQPPSVIYIQAKKFSELFTKKNIGENFDFDPAQGKFSDTKCFSYTSEEYSALLNHAYHIMTYGDSSQHSLHNGEHGGAKEYFKGAISGAFRKIVSDAYHSARS